MINNSTEKPVAKFRPQETPWDTESFNHTSSVKKKYFKRERKAGGKI